MCRDQRGNRTQDIRGKFECLVSRVVQRVIRFRSIRNPRSTTGRSFLAKRPMDLTNRISRAENAEQLGVQAHTIAKLERTGRFPLSDRVILYDRNEVRAAIELYAPGRPSSRRTERNNC